MNLSLLGFAALATFLALVLTKRLSAAAALILVPIAFAIIGGFGAGLGDMMLAVLIDVLHENSSSSSICPRDSNSSQVRAASCRSTARPRAMAWARSITTLVRPWFYFDVVSAAAQAQGLGGLPSARDLGRDDVVHRLGGGGEFVAGHADQRIGFNLQPKSGRQFDHQESERARARRH